MKLARKFCSERQIFHPVRDCQDFLFSGTILTTPLPEQNTRILDAVHCRSFVLFHQIQRYAKQMVDQSKFAPLGQLGGPLSLSPGHSLAGNDGKTCCARPAFGKQ